MRSSNSGRHHTTRKITTILHGIVYACRAGLGFALVENVGYILMQPTLTGQIEVWMLRAFLAVPARDVDRHDRRARGAATLR